MRKDRRSDEFSNRQHNCPHYSQTEIDQIYNIFSLFRMNKLQATKNDRIMCQNYEEKSGMRLVNSNCQSINTSSLAHNKENVQLGEKRKKAEVAVKNRPTGRVATISHKKQ